MTQLPLGPHDSQTQTCWEEKEEEEEEAEEDNVSFVLQRTELLSYFARTAEVSQDQSKDWETFLTHSTPISQRRCLSLKPQLATHGRTRKSLQLSARYGIAVGESTIACSQF